MKTTGDLQLVKRINRSVLLRLVRSGPGMSRARLAQASGLTKSTVSALVRELLDERWIVEASAPVAQDGMGRPSTPLWLDHQTRILLGLEIGVQQMRLVGVSLGGEVLSSVSAAMSGTAAATVAAQAVSLLHQAWQDTCQRGLLLSGIGVCLPGAVDAGAGVVRFAPNLGWRNLGFLALLTQGLADAGLPDVGLHLQNDGDAAALGEYEFATDARLEPLVFVNCDIGVGAGIVLHDRLFTGARGLAGEIGHSILAPGGLLCSCGRRGCAETLIGARALATPGGLERGAQALGILLQNLDVTFNPHLMVVGGSSINQHPELLVQASQVAAAHARSAGVPVPLVRAARYGSMAAAVGAAAVAWHRYLRPMHDDDATPARAPGLRTGTGDAGPAVQMSPLTEMAANP